MAIIRVIKKEHPYVQIDKRVFEDTRLSWRAKGIMGYLLSKPDGWKVNIKDIWNHGKEGRNAVQDCMSELKEFGYADLIVVQDEKGVFVGKEWVVSEEPKTGFTVKPDKPGMDKPINRESGFRVYSNNDLNSNNEVESGGDFENTPAPAPNFTPFKEEEKEKNKVPEAAAISAADAIEADGIISAWSAENLETVKLWHERSKRIFSLQEYDKLLLKFCGYYANHKDDGTQKRFLSNPLLFFRNQFSGWLVDQPKFDRAQPSSAPSAPINKFQLRPNPSKS